jgi:transcriptional antiterminator RfaH
MKRWYVVYTHPRHEDRALWHLRNQGFEGFLPRLRKLRRHARRKEPTLEPLFPRYLFVNLDLGSTAWRSINGTRGVVGVIGNDTGPRPVPQGVVESLRDNADQDGATPLTTLGVFTQGLKVRITSGVFAGHTGEIARVPQSTHERVQILLNFLGVPTRLPLPEYAIEAV